MSEPSNGPGSGLCFPPTVELDPGPPADHPSRSCRFVVVSGGICSSLGKGILASSLARLLIDRGLVVRNAKFDPYWNVDPGTMSPAEHGEVYVTDDGAEADLDLGSYYRFTGVTPRASSSVSAGQVLAGLLAAERRGDLLGVTVQSVPHVTGAVCERVEQLAAEPVDGRLPDVVVVELGGTVGDIEIGVFLEAFREFATRHNTRRDTRVCFIHLTLVPRVGPNREVKTKPSQHSVALLRATGIAPDVLVARSEGPLDAEVRTKLGRTCGVSRVVAAPDVSSVYAVPGALAAEGLDLHVLDTLGLGAPPYQPSRWAAAVGPLVVPPAACWKVGVVAKYLAGADTYLSVVEALRHAAAAHGRAVDIRWVDSEALGEADDEAVASVLGGLDAVVIPGGFGTRGIPGKLAAARHCRRSGLAMLGLCLGLQVAVVEFARHVASSRISELARATSAEWDEPGPQVVTLLDAQGHVTDLGGTMRLGACPARLVAGTKVAAAYGMPEGGLVSERHRHRFEVSPRWLPALVDAGLVVSGVSVPGDLVTFVELADHRFFVATQAHPELASRPDAPAPLFLALAESSIPLLPPSPLPASSLPAAAEAF